MMITLFLLTIYGVMVGGISQMREIVKEQEIYKRERLVNLQILPMWSQRLGGYGPGALYRPVFTCPLCGLRMPGSVLNSSRVHHQRRWPRLQV
jgi:hypothetical protein